MSSRTDRGQAFRFKAKDGELLALLGRAAANLRRTGELIDRLLIDWPESQELRGELLDCEHAGDRITHDPTRWTDLETRAASARC